MLLSILDQYGQEHIKIPGMHIADISIPISIHEYPWLCIYSCDNIYLFSQDLGNEKVLDFKTTAFSFYAEFPVYCPW